MFLASWAMAACAHASYGQMKLNGAFLLLGFILVVLYALVLNLALIVGIFRFRVALVIGTVMSLSLAWLLLLACASPDERAGFFKMLSGGSGRVILVATGAVLLPFIVIAPYAQHLAARRGERLPRWMKAWMAAQLALLPAFIVLAFTERHFWRQEFEAARAQGERAKAGDMRRLLDDAERRHERIWGTGWHYPWLQAPAGVSFGPQGGWTLGLALGVDASALIAADEPLAESDRVALRMLMDRRFAHYAVANIRARLVWDALVPGSFSTTIRPRQVSEDAIPALLDRFEKYGDGRICPDGRMADADRAALNALLLAKARGTDSNADYALLLAKGAGSTRDVRPPWDDFLRRVERLCR